MKRRSATARKRFRTAAAPKPRTIVSQAYAIEATEWRDLIDQDARLMRFIERSWSATIPLMLTGAELARNRGPALEAILQLRQRTAERRLKDYCDELLRRTWGSLLPRRKALP